MSFLKNKKKGPDQGVGGGDVGGPSRSILQQLVRRVVGYQDQAQMLSPNVMGANLGDTQRLEPGRVTRELPAVGGTPSYLVRGKNDAKGEAPTGLDRNWVEARGQGSGLRPEDRGDPKTGDVRASKAGLPSRPRVAFSDLDGERHTLGPLFFEHREGVGASGHFGGNPALKHAYGRTDGELANGQVTAGRQFKAGIESENAAGGDLGSVKHSRETGIVYSEGATAKGYLGARGGCASLSAINELGAYHNEHVEAYAPDWNVNGVDKPLKFGASVDDQTFAGVWGGGKGEIGLNDQYVGAKGSVGGFAGLENKKTANLNLGPLSLSGSLSGQAGVGAGADGGAIYKDGTFYLGGRGYIAEGLGGGLSGGVTVDVEQSAQLAKAGYQYADANKDGLLTTHDQGIHAGRAAEGYADLADKGSGRLMSWLDTDNSGQLSASDMKDRAEWLFGRSAQALDAKGAGPTALQPTTAQPAEAKDIRDTTKFKVGMMVVEGLRAVDHDGDGEIEVRDFVDAKLERDRKKGEARVAVAKRTLKGAQKMLDRSGDGKLGLNDVTAHGKDVVEGNKVLAKKAVETAKQGVEVGGTVVKEVAEAAVDPIGTAKKGLDVAGSAVDSAVKDVAAGGAALKDGMKKAGGKLAGTAEKWGSFLGLTDKKEKETGGAPEAT